MNSYFHNWNIFPCLTPLADLPNLKEIIMFSIRYIELHNNSFVGILNAVEKPSVGCAV